MAISRIFAYLNNVYGLATTNMLIHGDGNSNIRCGSCFDLGDWIKESKNENNGVKDRINLSPDFDGNCVVTGKVGCTTFYEPFPFCATSDVNILIPKFKLSVEIGLFLATIINFNENFRWNYGRQCRVGNTQRIKVLLPIKDGEPDWKFMEDYIKSLPYGDSI